MYQVDMVMDYLVHHMVVVYRGGGGRSGLPLDGECREKGD